MIRLASRNVTNHSSGRTFSTAVILLVAMLSAGVVRAQGNAIRVEHISVLDGLVDNRVEGIAQDNEGYMWIATGHGGLHKYDGYQFTVYDMEIRNPTWDLAQTQGPYWQHSC